ncbi:glycosyltransferase [candidate division WWE3 bacterium]|nr:glycosyltransferase [candidate division WWE3 bacterium]
MRAEHHLAMLSLFSTHARIQTMRIAVFIKSTTFHANFGGLETQNKVLCEGLVKRGHDVLVFAPQQELKFETKYENGVKYHFIPSVYRLLRFNKNNWYYKSQEAFQKFHKEKSFDLILSQSSAGVGPISTKDTYKVPAISISHGTILGEFRTRLQTATGLKELLALTKDTLFVLHNFFGRQRKFVHGSDKIIAVSSAVKEALVEETFTLEDKIEVINNGIDPKKIENAKPPAHDHASPSKKSILYVGQIQKSKGLNTLFKLAQEPEFKDVDFEVIGGGDYLEELRQKTKSANMQDKFRLHGKLPYEKVLAYFKTPSIKLFALPTQRVEGFPMVLVEALFAGLPIVAYDIGGVSDAVITGKTGFLVPAGDYETFKKHVLELLSDVDLQENLSKPAKDFAYSNLTLEAVLSSYEEVFEQVVDSQEEPAEASEL